MVAPARGELDGHAADAARGTGHEQHVDRRELERVDGGHGGDARQRRGASDRQVDAVGRAGDRELVGDGDQLGPGAVVHGRVGVQQEPVDLVAGAVAVDGGAGLLDHAGVVASEDDGVVVLGDRRRHLVTLTPAGERQLASASRAQKDTEDVLFASLDDDQREQLRGLLLVLRDGLAADPEGACTAAAEAGR
jgi:hypothetical protein